MTASHSCGRPILQMKAEELFMKWLTEKATMEVLHLNLQQLLQGESLTTLLSEVSHTPVASPRPQTPPHSSIPARSPRSPRRPIKGGAASPRKSVSRHTTPESRADEAAPATPVLLEGCIPRFHFPEGAPSREPAAATAATQLQRLLESLPNRSAGWEQMPQVADAMSVPRYWKRPLFTAACSVGVGKQQQQQQQQQVSLQQLSTLQQQLSRKDSAAGFVHLLTLGQRSFLVAEDLTPLVQDIVDTHPGLSFLQEAPEFHGRYVSTVVARIFFDVNASWSGRISCHELRRSRLLQTIASLQHKDDINEVTDFFSYEHFYVIYCKFWDIDTDHDLVISKEDLRRHNNYALSDRIIDRIFSGAVSRSRSQTDGKMSYSEFVWFLLAEEDKRHPRSIEYWFRCMDLDGDGVLSLYELEYFYSEQMRRMEEARIEEYQGLEDCVCTMLDMVKPSRPNCIGLRDLKRCKLSHLFFDTMFNLRKYIEYEQRDPFANIRDIQDGTGLSDWDKYAAEMYDILVAEENNGAMAEDAYPDDFELDDEPQEPLRDGLKFLESVKGSKEI